MDFIGPILEVLEFIGPGICKYLKYHQKLNDFVSNFKRLQEDLQSQRDAIESELHTRPPFGKRLNPEVTKWLEDAVEITKDAQSVEDKVRKGKYFSRACLGKLVEEKTQKMKLLYDKGKSLPIVVDDPSSSIFTLPTSELVGEEDVKEKIWSYLEGDQVYKIGVCGMGGIGKTTIMKHIHNELLKKDKCRRIVWATVSQEFDIGKLQKEIASGLNEKLEEDNNVTRRAAKLLAILESQGPFVLILDDVWTRFSLEEVGIPEPTAINGCRLVLTTRSKAVARAMGCEIIDVKLLKSDEALKLFLDKVGNDILSPLTLGLTLKIVDECAGLPLAIVTVAGSMRRISDPRLWKNALNELIEHKRTVAGTEADKFGILKSSYDHLKDEKIQHCFLYCALYPEDSKIQKDEIIEYWIEEGLIEEMQTRQAMKYKGHDILKKLEDNCLLEFIEDKFEGECVGMHHLLRGMALQITRKSPRFLVKAGRELPEEHEWKEDLLKVSLMFNYIKEIPSSLPSPKCPMLTTLLLSHNKLSTIPESFFDHMLGLKILDLSYNYELHSLPNSISKLVSLTTLLLKACQYLRKMPSLSNLAALKKLDLSRTSIEELPYGIEMLTNLKYLDLSQLETSVALPKIPDGMVPNLIKLQTLYVDYTIPLKMESGKLSKLENFMGRFLTLQDMVIFFKSRRDCLGWYNIVVGRRQISSHYDGDKTPIGMKFIQFFDAQIFGEPNLLPYDVQKLCIKECNDVRSLNDVSGFQNATNLLQCEISGCESMECVLSSWLNPLPSLYFLEIRNMKILNTLFDVEVVAKSGPPPTFFSSLKTIEILFCPKIKKLFSPRLLLGCVQNLEEIKVEACEELEEIIASEEAGASKLILPKLKRLELLNLPTLRCICSSTAALVCDSIEEVTIMYCSDLKCVFGSWFNPLQTLERLYLYELENLKSVFDEEALALLSPSPAPATTSFPLVSITIATCHQLKKLFSPRSLLSCLQNLETIEIVNCKQMEEIISLGSQEEEKALQLSLPKLWKLQLKNLPALKSICSNIIVLRCDSLKYLVIIGCTGLKRIPLDLPQLDNGQPLLPPSLKGINAFPKEWWESLKWDHPKAKDALLPFCRFPTEESEWLWWQRWVAQVPKQKPSVIEAQI